MGSQFQIKGTRDGLLVSMGEGPWEELHQVLIDELNTQADFLRGARLAIDVGETPLKAADLGQLTKELSELGLTLWAVISESEITIRSAQSFGLATRLPKPGSIHQVSQSEGSHQAGEPAVLVRRTLRSGFSLQYDGHVIVIGDVNPGAQLIASGDVIVWGKMRGTVHAGVQGNENAVVCALDLSPTQLRIAGVIAVAPRRRGKPQPEMALIKNGQVLAEVWDPKKERNYDS